MDGIVKIGALFAAALVVAPASGVSRAAAPEIVVYKGPTCSCCGRWIDHLEAAGFRVTRRDTPDMPGVKARYRVPAVLASCHTALAAGYVIEGHVPAAVIRRLLRERPGAVGIAVRAMPAGSPGMESERPVPYDVLLFDAQGTTTVYAREGSP